jgi:D-arabinose 1-dehydrogenase-like Zn-dependent alcohol dehydrogenase
VVVVKVGETVRDYRSVTCFLKHKCVKCKKGTIGWNNYCDPRARYLFTFGAICTAPRKVLVGMETESVPSTNAMSGRLNEPISVRQ